MKKTKKLTTMLLFIITAFMVKTVVYAEDITIENVITYMGEHNLLNDEEYFNIFGKVLNGNDEYNITSFDYIIKSTENTIEIKTTLTDKEKGEIENTTILDYQENTITYSNPNEIDSLESRIDTLLFTQLMYSIGGARGYNESLLVNWMNQIDLEKLKEEDGITSKVEKVSIKYEENNKKYNYILTVPQSYSIKINEVTDNIPASDYVKITEVKKDTSSIKISVYAEGHEDERCEIFRLNKDNKFEKVSVVSCNNGEYSDNNLEEDVTYTYQANIEDRIVCSDTKEIKTDKTPQPPLPPVTGAVVSIAVLIGAGLIGTSIYFLSKKYNLIKKV